MSGKSPQWCQLQRYGRVSRWRCPERASRRYPCPTTRAKDFTIWGGTTIPCNATPRYVNARVSHQNHSEIEREDRNKCWTRFSRWNRSITAYSTSADEQWTTSFSSDTHYKYRGFSVLQPEPVVSSTKEEHSTLGSSLGGQDGSQDYSKDPQQSFTSRRKPKRRMYSASDSPVAGSSLSDGRGWRTEGSSIWRPIGQPGVGLFKIIEYQS